MSRLIGTVSGALVAGGVYYAFSNMIQARTQKHTAEMHALSTALLSPPSSIPATPTAAERVNRSPTKSYMQGRWNEEIRGLLKIAGNMETNVAAWSRRWLYGGPRS
ncbi:hypothetical protein SCHPADRAFT_899286 [Schizopora paradoxa]|uniref:MICOS complex subunit MIC12 n=1 Tax=Schizopora paradoxa TaxID=27342 RepID=A0A0H2S4D0_9AGAM|nr:hypothetical protein SCHPADRAFT_899286 [Schizopora paradoxa]